MAKQLNLFLFVYNYFRNSHSKRNYYKSNPVPLSTHWTLNHKTTKFESLRQLWMEKEKLRAGCIMVTNGSHIIFRLRSIFYFAMAFCNPPKRPLGWQAPFIFLLLFCPAVLESRHWGLNSYLATLMHNQRLLLNFFSDNLPDTDFFSCW